MGEITKTSVAIDDLPLLQSGTVVGFTNGDGWSVTARTESGSWRHPMQQYRIGETVEGIAADDWEAARRLGYADLDDRMVLVRPGAGRTISSNFVMLEPRPGRDPLDRPLLHMAASSAGSLSEVLDRAVTRLFQPVDTLRAFVISDLAAGGKNVAVAPDVGAPEPVEFHRTTWLDVRDAADVNVVAITNGSEWDVIHRRERGLWTRPMSWFGWELARHQPHLAEALRNADRHSNPTTMRLPSRSVNAGSPPAALRIAGHRHWHFPFGEPVIAAQALAETCAGPDNREAAEVYALRDASLLNW